MQDRSVQLRLKHYLLNLLRMAIGWHFLYEGIVKFIAPNWTSAEYLLYSRWIFSPIFRWMASHEIILGVIDFLNVWGLMAIGLGLMLGCFTRIAAIAGASLLFLYYIAYPPFAGMDFGFPSEGHYMLINKNLIEMLALIAIAAMDTRAIWGVDRVLPHLKADRAIKIGDFQESIEANATHRYHRREIVKNFLTLPVVGAFAGMFALQKAAGQVDATTGATVKLDKEVLKRVSGLLPKGHLSGLSLSRMMLGGNLIGGYAHARDLIYVSDLFKSYNTERKIFETLMLCENTGVDSIVITPGQAAIINKYNQLYRGKMKTVVMVNSNEQVGRAVDLGASAIYVIGHHCDWQVRDEKLDALGALLDFMKRQHIPAGMGAHSIQAIQACVAFGLDPDFYVKTLHHDQYWSAHPRENRIPFSVDTEKSLDRNQFHDNMFCLFPEETIETMKTIDKPWIAFKVLAAGAIPPEDGFRYAFENGADFICVGMFDFQVVEDVNIATRVLKHLSGRERPWRG